MAGIPCTRDADGINQTPISATNPMPVASGYLPVGAVQLTNSNGVASNAQAQATLAATASKTNYLTSLTITGAGSTAGGTVTAVVAGLLGGSIYYAVTAPVGAAVPFAPIVVTFNPPLVASAVNTAITATVPALGAGNVASSVSITGFRI